MAEFIGSRISLISKSNIRYVGTLHEINSENSTVALEKVVSHGTEGRRGDPSQEIAPSDNIYEYIVFRGSDVKDLRIEEPAPREKPAVPPPDDPAILGHSHPGGNRYPPPMPPQAAGPFGAPPQHPYYQIPPQYQQRFGPGPYGPAPYGQYPGMPPNMPGQPPLGPMGPGMVPPQQMPPPPQGQAPQQAPQAPQQPTGPAQQPQPAPTGPQSRAPPQAPAGPAAGRQPATVNRPAQQPGQPQNLEQQIVSEAPKAQAAQPQPAGTDGAAPTQTPRGVQQQQQQQPTPNQTPSRVPTGPKGRAGAAQTAPAATGTPSKPTAPQTTGTSPNKPTTSDVISAIQDLSNKVSQATLSDTKPESHHQSGASNTTPGRRQPGNGNFGRGGRGGYRANLPPRKVEVPATDYDFDAANAMFNKQDLVKEVIATGDEEVIPHPEATNGEAAENTVTTPPAKKDFYNRGASFFDNISCENKERAEGGNGRRGGAAFRSEEQKKNLETFGQGSVDGYGSYRGGWRGRGRGRGYGRGRSGYGYRGGYRGGQQGAAAGAN